MICSFTAEPVKNALSGSLIRSDVDLEGVFANMLRDGRAKLVLLSFIGFKGYDVEYDACVGVDINGVRAYLGRRRDGKVACLLALDKHVSRIVAPSWAKEAIRKLDEVRALIYGEWCRELEYVKEEDMPRYSYTVRMSYLIDVELRGDEESNSKKIIEVLSARGFKCSAFIHEAGLKLTEELKREGVPPHTERVLSWLWSPLMVEAVKDDITAKISARTGFAKIMIRATIENAKEKVKEALALIPPKPR